MSKVKEYRDYLENEFGNISLLAEVEKMNHKTIEDVKRLIEFRIKRNWDYSQTTRNELKYILTELETLKI